MIALDTSVIIDLLKDKNEAKEIVNSIKEEIVSTDINYAELVFGINPKSKKHKEEEMKINSIFNKMRSFGLNPNNIKRSSLIKWSLKSQGKTIEPFDCLIAGILLENNVNKIITKNKKHFSDIKGLKVLSY